MNTISKLILITFVVFNTSLAHAKTVDLEKDGSKVIALASGKTIALKRVIHQPTIIQFWASWCEGCGETMLELYKYRRSNASVRMITVSVDEEMGEAKSYFVKKALFKKLPKTRESLTKIAVLDVDTRFSEALAIEAVPSVLVVDAKGNILFSHTGNINQKSPEFKKLKEIFESNVVFTGDMK